MTAALRSNARSNLTLDDLWNQKTDIVNPVWFVDHSTGFFVINCGRWREFGFCAGRLRWNFRYAAYLMANVKKAISACEKLERAQKRLENQ